MGNDTGKNHREGFRVLGLIPARAGSKSIPGKNTALLHGKPLVNYVIEAGKRSELITDLICSTNDSKTAAICAMNGVKAVKRPDDLCKDSTPILDVVKLHSEGYDAVALLQPTSPFVTEWTIDESIKTLIGCPWINSVQSVSVLPHNHHAYNQRFINDECFVEFKFKKEREQYYNKQTKPEFYVFGNFVVTRVSVLSEGLFAEPSFGLWVSRKEAIDIDTQYDLDLANAST